MTYVSVLIYAQFWKHYPTAESGKSDSVSSVHASYIKQKKMKYLSPLAMRMDRIEYCAEFSSALTQQLFFLELFSLQISNIVALILMWKASLVMTHLPSLLRSIQNRSMSKKRVISDKSHIFLLNFLLKSDKLTLFAIRDFAVDVRYN